jgi:bifunctional enzyme CysN/CysC
LQYRGFAGKVASGIVRQGDEVMVLPSGKTSKVKEITTYEGNLKEAFPPQAISISLEDEIDVSRGNMLVHPDNVPKMERHFEAMLVWMDEVPMDPYTNFYIKHNTHSTKARLDKIQYRVDVNTLEKSDVDSFKLNEIGRVVITTTEPLYFDAYKKNRQTGAFILIDPVSHNTVAVGMILDKVSSDSLPSRITDKEREHIVQRGSLVSTVERERRYDQKAQTIWITGLHGSGKNELAYALERELFNQGKIVVVFDGKSIRAGLSKELDYSPADRAEHLRRVAHICKLLNDQGIICIASFISPLEDIRQQVKQIIGADRFKMVYIDASVEYCKKNDKYGLYKLAEEGKLSHLAGVDEMYEMPASADLIINPEKMNLEEVLKVME